MQKNSLTKQYAKRIFKTAKSIFPRDVMLTQHSNTNEWGQQPKEENLHHQAN